MFVQQYERRVILRVYSMGLFLRAERREETRRRGTGDVVGAFMAREVRARVARSPCLKIARDGSLVAHVSVLSLNAHCATFFG
mgnify:CR=1 FL=1